MTMNYSDVNNLSSEVSENAEKDADPNSKIMNNYCFLGSHVKIAKNCLNDAGSNSLNVDCSNLFCLEKIDNLLQSETTPFHPEIATSIQELVLEMKILLDNLKNDVDSVTNPVVMSYLMRFGIIRQHLEKILSIEFNKLKECNIEKHNFEKYAFCVKSSALMQEKSIHSLLEQVNSCVKENKCLHDRLSFLKDKLQSFGLLKPQSESNGEFVTNFEILNLSSDVGETSEGYNHSGAQHKDDMPSDYLESLEIFKRSSDNLHTLSRQATNLQVFLNSLHKLNDDLISRVQDHELHMKGITKQLEEAHNLLAVMKRQHQKLQSTENIVKYDLQEKRRLLNKLKQQLEATRENCNLVRIKNSKSEAEWQDLRKKFVRRNKQNSEESGFIDDKEEIYLIDDKGEQNGFIIEKCVTDESSVVDNNACESDEPENDEVSLSNSDIESKYELKKNRLQLLEEQCQILCTNLKNSSNKRKELDYRLECSCNTIQNSYKEGSKKNNLSEVLSTDKDSKNSPVDATNGKVSIDFSSDTYSPLSSPEIGSCNSDSCSYFPHNSSTTSTGFDICLKSLKPEELVSNIVDLDNEFSFEHEHDNVDSDSLLTELHNECSTKAINSVQDSLYLGSVETFGVREKCEMENSDSQEMLIQMKVTGPINSPEIKSADKSVESDDLTRLVFELKEEKKLLQSRCQELEIKNGVILEKLHQKTQELQLAEAAKEQEVVALQFQLNSEILKYEKAIKECNDNNEGLKEMKQKVNDQEQIILTLEEALAEIQVERESEKEHQWEQLEEVKMSALKDKEMLEDEIILLRDDIKELQRKIIKLLKEKDILWKTNDRLRYLHKIQIDDRWVDDHEVSECLSCRNQFSFLLRKHHCRQCGRIFCHSCSNNWLLTPSSRRHIRVCNECYMQHIEIKTDVRRDSNVQNFDDSEDEAVVEDISTDMHPDIDDSIMSLPANLQQSFSSTPELHFSQDKPELPKRCSLNNPPETCHMEIVENDISGNLLIKANEEAILPILNEVNSTSISWSLEPSEAIPISLIYEDTAQWNLHQSTCETDGVIHLSLPGLYKFHFNNKSRSSSVLVRYSFKASILKEREISI